MADTKQWQIDLLGQETIDNRALFDKGGKTYKVYGTARISYTATARITIVTILVTSHMLTRIS